MTGVLRFPTQKSWAPGKADCGFLQGEISAIRLVEPQRLTPSSRANGYCFMQPPNMGLHQPTMDYQDVCQLLMYLSWGTLIRFLDQAMRDANGGTQVDCPAHFDGWCRGAVHGGGVLLHVGPHEGGGHPRPSAGLGEKQQIRDGTGCDTPNHSFGNSLFL